MKNFNDCGCENGYYDDNQQKGSYSRFESYNFGGQGEEDYDYDEGYEDKKYECAKVYSLRCHEDCGCHKEEKKDHDCGCRKERKDHDCGCEKKCECKHDCAMTCCFTIPPFPFRCHK